MAIFFDFMNNIFTVLYQTIAYVVHTKNVPFILNSFVLIIHTNTEQSFTQNYYTHST